jgi:hypothetical protein
MSDEKEQVAPDPKRHSQSLFAPLVLIAAGVLFLLDNLDLIPPLDWSSLLRFWPLLLIFLGLNLLVVQFRRPIGTFLSLLVGLAAIATFGYLLVVGAPGQVAGRDLSGPDAQAFTVSIPADGVDEAEIRLNLTNYASSVSASGGEALVSGTIWTTGEPVIESEVDQGAAEVTLGERTNASSFFNPFGWVGSDEPREWAFVLNHDIPTDLRVDVGNGSLEADLVGMTLARLEIEGGNGSASAILPAGSYEVSVEGDNGSLRLTLPDDGRQRVEVDGGNGSVRIYLPDGVPARIEFDEGNGNISADERFEQVSGDDERGALETAGYEEGAGVFLRVNSGNGSISVTEP